MLNLFYLITLETIFSNKHTVLYLIKIENYAYEFVVGVVSLRQP